MIRQLLVFPAQIVQKQLLQDVSIAEKRLADTNVLNVDLRDLIKMADVIITLKVMPESLETDLDELQTQIKQKIEAFEGEVGKVEIQPVAFGLKSLNIFFVRDESKGSVDNLEAEVEAMENVASVEVTDVRRAIG